MTMMINMFLFYQHILFIHREAKIADIYLFISGKGRNYFIPEDNELSYRLLKHIYNEGKVNNNRILCNQIQIYDSITRQTLTGKLMHFYRITSAKSVQATKAYYTSSFG